MNEAAILSSKMYFSYNQFFVFDKSVKVPACTWTEPHLRQGFARRVANAAFSSLLEFGYAEVTASLGPYKQEDDHERVIEVPIEVTSGELIVAGPEEFDDTRVVSLAIGHYRLVVAQKVTGHDQEAIELYFEALAAPLSESRILIADDALDPPSPLLETAETVTL